MRKGEFGQIVERNSILRICGESLLELVPRIGIVASINFNVRLDDQRRVEIFLFLEKIIEIFDEFRVFLGREEPRP